MINNMKHLFKFSILVAAILAFASCQKQMTASFSPSKASAYHDLSKTKTVSETIVKEETKEEAISEEVQTSTPDLKNINSEEIKAIAPVVSPEKNNATASPEKVSKKDIIKQVKAVKKQMKTNGGDKNNTLFLVVLLVLILALLVPGLLYWVLVALVVWLVLYLLGLI
jgi:Flp pilus assembly protein TadB